jgi:hypothetical protein
MKQTIGRVFRDEILELVDRERFPQAPPGAANVVDIKWFWSSKRDDVPMHCGGPFTSQEKAEADWERAIAGVK